MSISTLASDKVARNAQEPAEAGSSITDALAAVAAYIPTEIIAAYTLAIAIVMEPDDQFLPMFWFWTFLVATPLFVWLVYAAKSKDQTNPFLNPRLWPWWESAASMIAFAMWSATMPKSPLGHYAWYSPKVSAIFLVLVSTALPLIGKVALKTLPQPPAPPGGDGKQAPVPPPVVVQPASVVVQPPQPQPPPDAHPPQPLPRRPPPHPEAPVVAPHPHQPPAMFPLAKDGEES